MKNNFNLSICLLFILPFTLIAQKNLEFKWGSIHLGDNNIEKFMAEDDHLIYALATDRGYVNKPKMFLNTYLLSDFSLVKSTELKIANAPGKELEYEGFNILENK